MPKKHPDAIKSVNPAVWSWFTGKFGSPTTIQKEAVPAILAGRDALITSPTGTGKTLSAFLGIISRLSDLSASDRLESRVYCVYVAPLKALASDIEVNLKAPLREMVEGGFRAAGNIRVGVRTGDTPLSERRAMVARPPHIFITTPESFCLAAASPVSGLAFDSTRYLIIDELHDLMQSRRGALLSLFAGLLESRSGKLQRIGISATLADTEAAGRFLVGAGRGLPEVCSGARNRARLEYVKPREDLLTTPMDRVMALAAEDCADIVRREGTTLVFTNTRADAEALGQEIARIRGSPTAVHHGSVAEEERRRIETGLRDGAIDLAVCSSSMELGIDIGGVGAVVVFGSPGSVSRTAQRVGRSGHRAGEASKGFLIPHDLGDVLEMGALLAGHERGVLEPATPPAIGPDLLMQFIVGASTREYTDIAHISKVAGKAGCAYADEATVTLLANTLNGGQQGALLEIDGERLRATGRGRMVLFQNIGAVTNAPAVRVRDVAGSAVGSLSPGFAAELSPGEVLALGGGMYSVVTVGEREVVVEHSPARFPTVPAWGGEGLVRSGLVTDLARELLADGTQVAVGDIKAWRAEYTKRGLSVPGKDEIHVQTLEGEGTTWTLMTGILDRKVWAAFSRILSDSGACASGATALDDGLIIPGNVDPRKIRRRGAEASAIGPDMGHVRLVRTALASRALLTPETVGERELPFSLRSKRAWSIFDALPDDHPLRAEERRILSEESVRMAEAQALWNGIARGVVRLRTVDSPLLPLSRVLLARGARELLGLPRMLAMEFAHSLGLDAMMGGDAEAESRLLDAWGGRAASGLVAEKPKKGWRHSSKRGGLHIHPDLDGDGPAGRRNIVLECARLGMPSRVVFDDTALRTSAEALSREGAIATVRIDGEGHVALTNDLATALGADLGLWQLARGRGALALEPSDSFEALSRRYPLVRSDASCRARGLDVAPDEAGLIRGRYAGGRLAWVSRKDVPDLVSLYDAVDPDVDLSRLPRDGPFDTNTFRDATGMEPRDAAEAMAALEASGRIERTAGKAGRSILYRLVKRRRRGNWRPLLSRIVESVGAVTAYELSTAMNLDSGRARSMLAELAADGLISELRCGLTGSRYYAGNEFKEFAAGLGARLDGSVRCLPAKDPAVLWDAGDTASAVVFRDLVPVGSVSLESTVYRGHVRARTLPKGLSGDERLAAMRGAGVVLLGRAPRIFSVEGAPSAEGWKGLGRFSVSGTRAMDLDPEEAAAIVIHSQRLCPERFLADARDALAFMDSVDSDLQLAARGVRGAAVPGLVREGWAVKVKTPSGCAGTVIANMLPKYARALNAPLSEAAKHLLEAIRERPYARWEVLSEAAGLTEEAARATGDELVNALLCVPMGDGRLTPVKLPRKTREEAAAEMVMREIDRCGMVRAEELLLDFARIVDEQILSDALEALWDAGKAEPVFAVRGSDSIYWRSVKGRVGASVEISVVPPGDRAWPVLVGLNPDLDASSGFLVFRGGELIGRFTASVSQRRLVPSSIEGGRTVVQAGKELAHRAGLAWGKEIPQTEDWEVLDWWERTRGFGKDRVDFG